MKLPAMSPPRRRGPHGFDPQTPHSVIYLITEELLGVDEMGGTRRLARGLARSRKIQPFARTAQPKFNERHRHRYEFIANTKRRITDADSYHRPRADGKSGDRRGAGASLVLGCQFHPEFPRRSRCQASTFLAFIGAARARGPKNRQRESATFRGRETQAAVSMSARNAPIQLA